MMTREAVVAINKGLDPEAIFGKIKVNKTIKVKIMPKIAVNPFHFETRMIIAIKIIAKNPRPSCRL